jgi:hypothetical protein
VRQIATVAGLVGPPVFALSTVALTISEWTFLRDSGWSAVRRTAVEWPSLLALGPQGYLLVTTFFVCGLLGLAFAAAFTLTATAGYERLVGGLLAVLAFAALLEAAKPDAPDTTGVASWHDRVHNSAYPLIPLTALTAAAIIAARARSASSVRVSRLTVAVMSLALAATFVAAIAQLARYLFFATLLCWLEALAIELWRDRLSRRLDDPVDRRVGSTS